MTILFMMINMKNIEREKRIRERTREINIYVKPLLITWHILCVLQEGFIYKIYIWYYEGNVGSITTVRVIDEIQYSIRYLGL
jgi:hypothetical protein